MLRHVVRTYGRSSKLAASTVRNSKALPGSRG